ncbi:uncharacterized protein TNCV_1876511 [Trichonephila clavipes]|nr:uncharacterized protein TNCV_1876511 [Trichonephila clavipes]
MLSSPYGDILRLKAFVYDVFTVSTSVVIHKYKFCAYETPKQTFQNNVPINFACHSSNLNMQVILKPRITSPSPNEQSFTTETVSFNDVLLVEKSN